MTSAYPKIGQLKSVPQLRERVDALGLTLPVDDEILTADAGSPLASPLVIGGFTVGNRWCIHPMEGWDANRDGSPSAHTLRRWRNFGLSGAKLIWGGEAAAVVPEGRANPNQTLATPKIADRRRLTRSSEHIEVYDVHSGRHVDAFGPFLPTNGAAGRSCLSSPPGCQIRHQSARSQVVTDDGSNG